LSPRAAAAVAWLTLLAALLAACDTRAPDAPSGAGSDGSRPGAQLADTRTAAAAARQIPAAMQACVACHRRIVASYLAHGMSDSLGPLDGPLAGSLENVATGNRYDLVTADGATRLIGTAADGGWRQQRIVGRIGAGVMDTSFVGAETDPTGATTGRLFFAPVERLARHGLQPAPFERDAQPAGLDQPVTADCLQCHTTADPARLPGAGATAGGAAPGTQRRIYPANLLGADALATLPALGCDACHGDTARHVDVMLERLPSGGNDIGLQRLSELPAAAQRDVCARCHLEGEGHLQLLPPDGYGPCAEVLHAARPVLVPQRPGDDFRFVGQVERLALSACFRASGKLTCTSCHAPHEGVAAQGPASFDRACLRCHSGGRADCSREDPLRVIDVTGEEARTPDGCVDCHVRRSQPFDLPLLRTADHFVRRRIPRPAELPMRHSADPQGALQPFDDGRLAGALATPGGRAWSAGLAAAGLFRVGRTAEAAALLEEWSAGQATAEPPPGLPPLERSADFAHLRGLILEAAGRAGEASAAYGHALELDAALPEARVNRAALSLASDRAADALADAALLAQLYPRSEMAWKLRARAAAQAGNQPAAAAALSAATERWGSDPATWHELGRLLLRLHKRELAAAALGIAARLAPSRPGLAEDLLAAGAR